MSARGSIENERQADDEAEETEQLVERRGDAGVVERVCSTAGT